MEAGAGGGEAFKLGEIGVPGFLGSVSCTPRARRVSVRAGGHSCAGTRCWRLSAVAGFRRQSQALHAVSRALLLTICRLLLRLLLLLLLLLLQGHALPKQATALAPPSTRARPWCHARAHSPLRLCTMQACARAHTAPHYLCASCAVSRVLRPSTLNTTFSVLLQIVFAGQRHPCFCIWHAT